MTINHLMPGSTTAPLSPSATFAEGKQMICTRTEKIALLAGKPHLFGILDLENICEDPI